MTVNIPEIACPICHGHDFGLRSISIDVAEVKIGLNCAKGCTIFDTSFTMPSYNDKSDYLRWTKDIIEKQLMVWDKGRHGTGECANAPIVEIGKKEAEE